MRINAVATKDAIDEYYMIWPTPDYWARLGAAGVMVGL